MNYKMGIAIAIIFLIVVGVVIYIFIGPSSIGQPSSRVSSSVFLQPIKIGYGIGGLTPTPTGSGAGAIYLLTYARMTKLANDRHALQQLTNPSDPTTSPQILSIVKLLEQAATKTISRKYLLFIPHVRLPRISDILTNHLNAIGQVTSAYAAGCINDKQQKKAAQALTALLIFGQRLWRHGLFVDVRTCGLSDIDSAAAGLRMLYKFGPAKNLYEYHTAAKLLAATDSASRRWYSKQKIVDVLNPHSGDMAYIVRHDRDLSWRLDAMLELGIARWTTSYAPRAHAIAAFLRHYTKSPNHWISAAAKRAYGMTAETMNELANN
ncbi:MAG: hypothetical protein M0Z50_16385 [Planctomycetia bacterium]|nr:hypothetical protein [Planctomycetia bacterium]